MFEYIKVKSIKIRIRKIELFKSLLDLFLRSKITSNINELSHFSIKISRFTFS
jgi:hypothetical protein